MLNQIALQSPANAGTLAATGSLTVDAGAVAGFDIYSTIRDGLTVEVQALASITAVGGSVHPWPHAAARGPVLCQNQPPLNRS